MGKTVHNNILFVMVLLVLFISIAGTAIMLNELGLFNVKPLPTPVKNGEIKLTITAPEKPVSTIGMLTLVINKNEMEG